MWDCIFDGLMALADSLAIIFSRGAHPVSKARQAALADQIPKQVLKADKDALSGDCVAIHKDIAEVLEMPTLLTLCPFCGDSIDCDCGCGYCARCGAWLTRKTNPSHCANQ